MVLSKLKAAPAALRERLPGGGAPDVPVPDPSDALPDAVPVPERDALPDGEELPEASDRDKLTLGLTLLTVVGALLALVGIVARVAVKRRRQTGVDIEVVDEDDEEPTEDAPAEREYPKIAPLVGMAALVAMRLFVQRLARNEPE
jgi:hypothetical protein